MYSLSYGSLTHIKNCHAPTHLAGSSYFKCNGKEITRRKRSEPDLKDEGKLFDRYIETCTELDYYKIGRDPEVVREALWRGDYYADALINYRKYQELWNQPRKKNKRIYRLNKSKVRKKMSAFCRLEKSRKFLAFYSISFPCQAADNVLYTVFNKWLTNLRRHYGLKSYIWIAERQSNGTLHFHMLSNDFMRVQEINRAMATAINGEVSRGNMSWGESSVSLYNGVDVDSPQFPKKRQNENRQQYRERRKKAQSGDIGVSTKWIVGYLIKYVTKNNAEFNRLAYHSSRDVSRLFTSHIINDSHMTNVIATLPDDADLYKVYENEEICHYSFLFTPPDYLFSRLDKINEIIYYEFHNYENWEEDD